MEGETLVLETWVLSLREGADSSIRFEKFDFLNIVFGVPHLLLFFQLLIANFDFITFYLSIRGKNGSHDLSVVSPLP